MKKSILLFLVVQTTYLFGQTVTNPDTSKLDSSKTKNNSKTISIESLQQEILTLKDSNNKNTSNSAFHWGMSLGYNRIISKKKIYDAYISPFDSTIQFERIDYGSIVLSTSLMVSPFEKSFKEQSDKIKIDKTDALNTIFWGVSKFLLKHLGKVTFIATINLADFSLSDNTLNFNKKIDGGLGFGYKVNDDFYIATTFEKMTVRQPRTTLIEHENKRLTDKNGYVVELDKTNNNLFFDQYFTTLSLKFIYTIK